MRQFEVFEIIFFYVFELIHITTTYARQNLKLYIDRVTFADIMAPATERVRILCVHEYFCNSAGIRDQICRIYLLIIFISFYYLLLESVFIFRSVRQDFNDLYQNIYLGVNWDILLTLLRGFTSSILSNEDFWIWLPILVRGTPLFMFNSRQWRKIFAYNNLV